MYSVEEILSQVRKCQFCGFCDSVCPTYDVIRMRHYGSRGRINLILYLLEESKGIPPVDALSKEVVDGIFTCLHCGACNTQCPAGIDIADVILSFRSLILSQRFKVRSGK